MKEKDKIEKRRGETLFVPRRNADKSVWSPRRGRRLWKSRERRTRARACERARDETTDPSKALRVVGIVCSRRCLRWWAVIARVSWPFVRSPPPSLSPVCSRRRFFHRPLFRAYFSRTPHASSDNVRRKSVSRASAGACGCRDNSFPRVTRDFQRAQRGKFYFARACRFQ